MSDLMSRTRIPFAITLLFCVLPLLATAQEERQINILALVAVNPTKLLVRHLDLHQGTSLQRIEVPTGEVLRGEFVENRNQEKARIRRLTRGRFPVEAAVNQVEPRGRYTILGAPAAQGKNYQILAMRDGRIGVLADIPLRREEGTDNYAKGMLKEVVWAPNGKTIIVVVNQQIELPDGPVNSDAIHFVRFRQWRVRWMTPATPGEQGGETTTTP